MDAIFPRRDLGEAAPAAADLEQALAGFQVEPVEQQLELALLRPAPACPRFSNTALE